MLSVSKHERLAPVVEPRARPSTGSGRGYKATRQTCDAEEVATHAAERRHRSAKCRRMIVLLRRSGTPPPRLASPTLDRLKKRASNSETKFVRRPATTTFGTRQCPLIHTSSTKKAASGAPV